MQTLDKYLETDHKQCDTLLEQAHAAATDNDWRTASGAVRAFAASLLRHIEMEEDVLFPALEQAAGNGLGPTAVMRTEHAQLRRLLESVSTAALRRDDEDFFATVETLRLMLGQHNLKEEGVLYPMAMSMLGARSADVLEAMQNPVADHACCGQCGGSA